MIDTPSGALISECRTYRYVLWRVWDTTLPLVMIMGVNPSTADEFHDDATILRTITFAKSWGYGGVVMCNLFAFRARDPRVMKAVVDPVGKSCDNILKTCARKATTLVAAWGVNGTHRGRDVEVLKLLAPIRPWHALKLTKDGHPSHPLYLPGNLKPYKWFFEDSL